MTGLDNCPWARSFKSHLPCKTGRDGTGRDISSPAHIWQTSSLTCVPPSPLTPPPSFPLLREQSAGNAPTCQYNSQPRRQKKYGVNRLNSFTLAAVQHPGVVDLDLLEFELIKPSLSSVSFINVGYKYKQNKSYIYLIQ